MKGVLAADGQTIEDFIAEANAISVPMAALAAQAYQKATAAIAAEESNTVDGPSAFGSERRKVSYWHYIASKSVLLALYSVKKCLADTI